MARSAAVVGRVELSATVPAALVLPPFALINTALFGETKRRMVLPPPLLKTVLPSGDTTYVFVKAASAIKLGGLSWSWVPVSVITPSAVATPSLGLTPGEGVTSPKKKLPKKEVFANVPPICGSTKPDAALASVPTRKPLFRSAKYRIGWVPPPENVVRPVAATLYVETLLGWFGGGLGPALFSSETTDIFPRPSGVARPI